MKVTVTVPKQIEVKTLHVEAEVRYWEDAVVNGVEDETGSLVPCREGEIWKPIIDLETGQIINWEKGKTAEIHYKVCDAGTYELKDSDGNTVAKREGYVPDIMCPKEEGYGDYIIMDVDKDGVIANWKADVSSFNDED